MNLTKHLAGLALALALPLAASAADLSWDFIDVRYMGYEEPGVDGDGFGIAGSKAMSDEFVVFGAYEDLSVDVLGFDAGVVFYRVGLGHHRPINDQFDYFADFSYEAMSVEVLGVSADDSGYGFRIGLRGNVGENFELSGGIRYVEIGVDDTRLALGAVWNATETFGITFNFEDGDASIWSVGGRFSFD